ncbi:ribosome silencing factor [Nocardia speluncae]|uniref:Ribosomal silencing factor RsfS n=1 Tax=Nocardia speluncae TaxID=419477 RepID=A0A846XGU7_9NOCA|nr:ribosome silencing factor [Nocardia speluncae]NKY34687.1 ribosome silencing factor [Nocardia speluncae]
MTATAEAVQIATVAALAADEKLAADVVVLDVSEQLVITDCFVIASAPNERQVNAIVDNVEEKLRAAGHKPVRREGTREGRWALLDYVDVVVHIQHNDERNFYALERLWKDCPVVPVEGIGMSESGPEAVAERDHGGPSVVPREHGVPGAADEESAGDTE